jgi:hypothetical protein
MGYIGKGVKDFMISPHFLMWDTHKELINVNGVNHSGVVEGQMESIIVDEYRVSSGVERIKKLTPIRKGIHEGIIDNWFINRSLKRRMKNINRIIRNVFRWD